LSDGNELSDVELMMAAIESQLTRAESYAFTESKIPVVVDANRSGSEKIRVVSPIHVFTIAVGDTDAIEQFRAHRDKIQAQIGAQRAVKQNGIIYGPKVMV
jgi:hypothetical protein